MSGRLDAIVAALRQVAFPREFRIPAAGASFAGLDAVQALIETVTQNARSAASPDAAAPALDPAVVRKLANVAWNLMGQAARLGDTSFDRAFRQRLDILRQILEDAGIEMVDYTGQDFDDGEIWDEVLGSERRKLRPVIVSMSRPRVRYRGEVIQRGMPVVEDRDDGAAGGREET